jgi:hypothetical protein
MNLKLYIYLFIGILVLLFSFFYTNTEQDTYKKSNTNIEDKQVIDIQQDSEEELIGESNTEDAEESFGLKDIGTPCKFHKYILAHGAFESLTFSMKEDRGREIGPVDISIGDNDLDGFSILAESAEVISKTVEYPIWIINADDLFADQSNSHQKLHSFTQRVRVDLVDGGRGILSERGGLWGYEGFGKKTEEELAKILNSQDLVIEYKDYRTDKTYSWQVERDYSEKNVKILTATIAVSIPDNPNNLSMKKSFDIKIGSRDSIGILIKYSQFEKRYAIHGNGFDVNCL